MMDGGSASGEVRVANAINTTMLAALSVLFMGAAAWMFAISLPWVGAIYRSLSAEQQRHLTVFGSSLLSLLLGVRVVFWSVAGWLKRRRAAA